MQPGSTTNAPNYHTHERGYANPLIRGVTKAPQKPLLPPEMAFRREQSPAILVGEAGSNLVLSRLQSWGIVAQPAMPGVAYDLIADVPGVDMLRVQVKTQSRPRNGKCSFNLHRGFYRSKSGMFRYAAYDFDIAALVCLSIGQIHFCAAPIHQVSFRATWERMPETDSDSFQLALSTYQTRRRAECLAWLASMEPDMLAESSEDFCSQTPMIL